MQLKEKIDKISTINGKIYISLNKGLTKKQQEILLKFLYKKYKYISYKIYNNHKKVIVLTLKIDSLEFLQKK